MSKKVIIIGAGLGGLSAATSLASRGFQVEIFEKNDKVGGKLNQVKKGGFSFDLGPSIFTLPHLFEALFKRAGKRMEDYFTLQPVSPHWRNFFEDGTVVDLYKENTAMKAELDKLGPGLYEQFLKFREYSRKQYDIVSHGYFDKGLDTTWQMIKYYGLWELMVKLDSITTMDKGVRRYFSNPYLIDIFNFFIKYVGSSAIHAPGFFNLMPHIQFGFDLWYVKDGMYNLARALEKLLGELNVPIHCNSEAVRIEKEGGKVTGISLAGGETISADIVVSNMEVIPAYQSLLREPDSFMGKLKKFEPACSGLALHLGLNKLYPQLAHHNFFFSGNQTKHFTTVFTEKKLPDDPTIYLVAVTRTDPTQAPEGCDHIKILPHIPYINEEHPYTDDDYLAFKERILDKLERMGLKDLRKNTVEEHMWTPRDIQKHYYSNGGSIYGVVSDKKKNFGFKAPKKSTRYNNLYFVGGSVNPGGGMPMVVLCGQKAADLILEEHG